jgi:hypothetical protein
MSMVYCPFLDASPSGDSDEADYINKQDEANWTAFQRSRFLGDRDLFEELAELAEECQEPNWDGYGADAIDDDAVREAGRFLRGLPMGFPRPSLGVEPDGHVTFEWHASPRRTLSVSISPDGMLHYSALIGTSRRFGTEPFLGQCPTVILDLARRVGRT